MIIDVFFMHDVIIKLWCAICELENRNAASKSKFVAFSDYNREMLLDNMLNMNIVEPTLSKRQIYTRVN